MDPRGRLAAHGPTDVPMLQMRLRTGPQDYVISYQGGVKARLRRKGKALITDATFLAVDTSTHRKGGRAIHAERTERRLRRETPGNHGHNNFKARMNAPPQTPTTTSTTTHRHAMAMCGVMPYWTREDGMACTAC